MQCWIRHSVLWVAWMTVVTVAAQEFTPTFMSQYDRVGVGIRGGWAGHMQSPERKGWETMVDVQYAHYWRHDDWHGQLGLVTGVGFGFSRSQLGQQVVEQRSYLLHEGALLFPIDYSVECMAKEQDQQWQVEIPLLFSYVLHCGWYMNVGPRLQVPVAGRYHLQLDNETIAATYSQWTQQPVVNMPTTGQLTDENRHTQGALEMPKVNLLLGAETGYEHMFNDKNRLTVGVYGHANVLPHNRTVTDNAQLLLITPPTAENNAVISPQGWSNTYSKTMGYFALGVRLIYFFVW